MVYFEEQKTAVVAETITAQAPQPNITTEGVTTLNPITEVEGGYVVYDNRLYSKSALNDLKPDLIYNTSRARGFTSFGARFPMYAKKGETFVRVDVLPNKVFKFDGKRWIEVNKKTSTGYLDDAYLKYLSEKIKSGEIDEDLLLDEERASLAQFHNKKN